METIQEAKKFVEKNLLAGCECPVCNQLAKLYHRSITSAMAHSLCLLYDYFAKNPNQPWVHVENYLKKLDISSSTHGDYQKWAYWGCLENKMELRNDGSDRNGYWRITEKGKQFVRQQIKLPKYCWAYNKECRGLDGEYIDIMEAGRNRFDYNQLMGPYIRPVKSFDNDNIKQLSLGFS